MYPTNQTGNLSADEKNMAMFCHLSSLAGYFVGVGHFLGPLILWLMKKDQSAFVDVNGKESLNFQISIFIYFLVTGVVCGILTLIVIGVFLAMILFPAIAIFHLVVTIQASMAASNGQMYRYPLCIRFLS